MDGIKAILLDIDGTILDTSEFIYQATEYALAHEGYTPISRSKISEAMGMSFEEFYFFLVGRRDVDTTPLQVAHGTFQLEHMDLSFPFPNAQETLSTLKKRGYKIAAVTNRVRKTLMPTLSLANLTQYFDAIIAGDDTPEVKPSPVHVETALRAVGVNASQAVMVGDTDVDMKAGTAAGVKTVRALYGHHFNFETETKADFYIKDVRELLSLFP